MGRALHALEKGLKLVKVNGDLDTAGDSVDKIFDAGAPIGTSGETDEAPIGSTYNNTTNGDMYIKNTDTSSAVDWTKLAVGDGDTRKQLTGVVAAPQILDSVLVDDVLASEWEIHFFDEAVPANLQTIKVFATHNGTAAADATLVDDTGYGKLKFGTSITHDIIVELSGAGAAQVMRLSVEGQVGGVTFTSRRNDIKAP